MDITGHFSRTNFISITTAFIIPFFTNVLNFRFQVFSDIRLLRTGRGYTYFWLITAGRLTLTSVFIHVAYRGVRYLFDRIRQ